jgi:hypothetical protein
MLNHPAMREFDYFKRILDERSSHLIPAFAPLDLAQMATDAYLSVPMSQRFAAPHIVLERDSHRLVDVYAKIPFISRDFCIQQAESLEPHYDFLRDISSAYSLYSCLQIDCSDRGAGLIAVAAGNPKIKTLHWTGEYPKTYQNINRFYDYYSSDHKPNCQYRLPHDLQTLSGYQMTIVSGKDDFETRKKHIDQALESDSEIVIMTDYFSHPKARFAAKQCAKEHNRLLRLVHTDLGIALWDKSPGQHYSKDLDKKGITQLIH